MAKKESKAPAENANDRLNKELAGSKLINLVHLCENLSDMSVRCVSTGLPQLDQILHPVKRGLPEGRDVEIYSRKSESGKTSLAMQILSSFQRQGKRTALADVERTTTDELFAMHGIVTDPRKDPGVCALRMMRSCAGVLSAEEFLDGVKGASRVFDLVVVDSVAALESRANLDKETDDDHIPGGASRLLGQLLRGNLARRATVVWINQVRSKMGGAMPGMGEQITRPGGRALDFFVSIILELSMVKRLTASEGAAPYGMKVKVFAEKNKIAAQWRACELTYLFFKGFSAEFDYLELAEKAKIVTKTSGGGWLTFRDQKVQGMLNFVTLLEQKPELFAELRKLVDGEDVAAETVKDATRAGATVTEGEEDDLAGLVKGMGPAA